ncbi:hypothetical protein CHUAL_001891 [Chamberlinius hualienensis]|uniref:Cytochrome P450 20A1 n=1 Tax=Chamberlinius hualienensis TaxID=1551368 RepID=A0A1J1E8S6_9MYRI|nr:cytochrome P450 20A1 [Chamberlinius hualienensis]
MSIALLLLSAGVVILLVFLIIFRVNRNSTEQPLPGPPHVINEMDVFSKRGGGMPKFVIELHQKYGPIVFFTIGNLKMVSIGSPELYKEHQHLFDRPVELFIILVEVLGKGTIQIANGERGKFLHKSLSRPFSFPECKNYYPMLRKIGNSFVNKLETLPKHSHVPLLENMLILIIKEVLLVAFGYEFDDEDIARKQLQNYKDAFGDVFYGDEEAVKTKDENMYKGIVRYRQLLIDVLNNRLKTRHMDSNTHFVDVLLDLGLDKDEELDNAVSFFTAAFHTTAHLLTWLLYYLGEFQHIQDKVRLELDNVLKGADVSNDNLQQLTYLHQVIDETLRTSFVAPFAARVSDVDVQLGGYTVPANTPVVHCLGHSLTDPKYWSNPGTLPSTEFDPERFSEEHCKNRPALSFAPFGFAGKRICPGYRFAYVVAIVLVSIILRKYRVKLVDGQDIRKVIGLVTKPTDEIWVIFEDL